MQKIALTLFLCTSIWQLSAQESDDSAKYVFKSFITQQTKNNYNLGEHLEYDVMYSIFNIGIATLITDTVLHVVNNLPTYKIDLLAKNRMYTRVFSVIDELLGSYTDTVKFKTIKSYKYAYEGGYEKDEVAVYDYKNSRVKLFIMGNKEREFRKGKEKPMLPNSFDLTTLLMNFRSQNFDTMKKGDFLIGNCFIEEDNFFIHFYYDGKEVIRTPLGKVHAIRFKIQVQKTNILKQTDEPIHTILVSDDDNHIPLRITTLTNFGKIKIVIESVKNQKYPMTSLVRYRKRLKKEK